MANNGNGSPFGYGGGFTGLGSKLFDLWMLGILWQIGRAHV